LNGYPPPFGGGPERFRRLRIRIFHASNFVSFTERPEPAGSR
jgi:hypothetical protein